MQRENTLALSLIIVIWSEMRISSRVHIIVKGTRAACTLAHEWTQQFGYPDTAETRWQMEVLQAAIATHTPLSAPPSVNTSVLLFWDSIYPFGE